MGTVSLPPNIPTNPWPTAPSVIGNSTTKIKPYIKNTNDIGVIPKHIYTGYKYTSAGQEYMHPVMVWPQTEFVSFYGSGHASYTDNDGDGDAAHTLLFPSNFIREGSNWAQSWAPSRADAINAGYLLDYGSDESGARTPPGGENSAIPYSAVVRDAGLFTLPVGWTGKISFWSQAVGTADFSPQLGNRGAPVAYTQFQTDTHGHRSGWNGIEMAGVYLTYPFWRNSSAVKYPSEGRYYWKTAQNGLLEYGQDYFVPWGHAGCKNPTTGALLRAANVAPFNGQVMGYTYSGEARYSYDNGEGHTIQIIKNRMQTSPSTQLSTFTFPYYYNFPIPLTRQISGVSFQSMCQALGSGHYWQVHGALKAAITTTSGAHPVPLWKH